MNRVLDIKRGTEDERACAEILSDLQTGSRADFEFVSTENAPRAEKNIFLDKVVSEYP